MSFIPENFAEVTISIDIPGDAGPANCVQGVQVAGGGDAQAIANAFSVFMTATDGPRAVLSDQYTITSVTARKGIGGGLIAVADAAVNQVGLQTGSVSPPQVCHIIQKSSGLAGKTNRGRMYWPGVVESVVDDGGFLTVAYRNAVQTAFDEFDADMTASALPPVILHTNPALTPSSMIAFAAGAKVATQRRRLR